MANYIDKAALLAEIEKLKGKVNDGSSYCNGWQYALRILELSLDSLEVKEVDLEKEHKDWLHQHFYGSRDHNASGDYLQRSSQLDMAKHFFELGMRSTITKEDCKLIWNIGDEIPNMPEEEFFKELLKRYKAQKGE